MLARRHLRIRVLQVLYTYYQSEGYKSAVCGFEIMKMARWRDSEIARRKERDSEI